MRPIINLPDYTPLEVAVSGDAVMLMCLAHGRSKISYQWEHRINNFDNWIVISVKMDSGLLILPSVTKYDEGIYRCVACDCYSCSYSINTTTLTLIGKEIGIGIKLVNI